MGLKNRDIEKRVNKDFLSQQPHAFTWSSAMMLWYGLFPVKYLHATNVEGDLSSKRLQVTNETMTWDHGINLPSHQIRSNSIISVTSKSNLTERQTKLCNNKSKMSRKKKKHQCRERPKTPQKKKSVTCQVVCRRRWWIRPFHGCWHSRSLLPGCLSPSGPTL